VLLWDEDAEWPQLLNFPEEIEQGCGKGQSCGAGVEEQRSGFLQQ
jgi:hypothetical protein